MAHPHYQHLTTCRRPLLLHVLLVLALLAAPRQALPIRSHDAAPDHWADLLRADRFTLQRMPPRTLYADDHAPAGAPSARQLNLTARAAAFAADPPRLPTVARSTSNTFQGRGKNCRLKVVVVNAPDGLNVQAAISEVIAIMGDAWRSTVPLDVHIAFADLGAETVLAQSGNIYFVRMNDVFNTVMPVAAAEAFRQRNLNGALDKLGKFDVQIRVNRRTKWYAGPANTVGAQQYDLVTVLLQEFYHNLVFAGSIHVDVRALGNDKYEQTARLWKDYRTRFDSFLATEKGCAVLGYLGSGVDALSSEIKLTKSQMLAEAVCNDQLYWYAGGQRVAKLFAPRIFLRKSSVYHLDPKYAPQADSGIMFPAIKRNRAVRNVGKTIILMQGYMLDPKYDGARTRCALVNPVVRKPTPSDKPEPEATGGVAIGTLPIVFQEPRRVAGLPVWALVLIILFAILLLLLLLGLCLLLLKRKKQRSQYTSSRHGYTSSKYSFSSRLSKSKSGSKGHYLPGWGNTKSSTTKKDTTTVAESSHHDKSKSKTPTTTVDEQTTTIVEPCPPPKKKKKCCKAKHKCKCRLVCEPVSRPPPVASVHTFDPDCVPSSKKSHHHHHHHHHHHKKCRRSSDGRPSTEVAPTSCRPKHDHSVNKTLTKSSSRCKRTSSKCHYDVTTSGELTCEPSSSWTKCAPSSSKCAPSSSKCPPSSSTRCAPTSTKCASSSKKCSSRPPPPSTKPPSSKVCGSSSKSRRPPPPSTKPPKCDNMVEITVNQNC